jgi:hypothetical protein
MIKLELEYNIRKSDNQLSLYVYSPTIGIGSKKYFYDHNSALKETAYETFVANYIFFKDDPHNKFRIKEFMSRIKHSYGSLSESIEITNKEKIINDLRSALGIKDDKCNYEKDSVSPCDNCPQKYTALHMCKLLQENPSMRQSDALGVDLNKNGYGWVNEERKHLK